MFPRLPLRPSGQYALFNVDHIVRVEDGAAPDAPERWSRLHHLPVRIDAEGNEVLTTTEVNMDIDRMGMLLSGKWMKDPM